MKKLAGMILFCMSILPVFGAEPKCYWNLADNFFFQDKAIMQALSLHQVTESSWTPIIRELQRQSRSIKSKVRQRAQELAENPFEPYQANAAEKLLMHTLLEIFQGVLNSYLITNGSDITEMFEYIQRHQPLWKECFKPVPY